jgi:NAD(P)-dependent dehydrogenase (short-subunit alcohol dehydrogenase family)
MTEPRVAIVTGGGRGIGRGIALGLAADGFDVAITYRRDAEAAAATVAEIEEAGSAALAIPADVSVSDDNARTVSETVARFGRIDALISNGGIASRGRSVVDTDPEELLRVMTTHALGPHNLCAAAIPHLRTAAAERGRSDVVVISSVATLSHGANGAPYSMGKAALESLALTLAKEERANGIHVNIVAPGLVETDMGRRLVKGAAGIEDIRTLDATMPFGRVCQPEDIADAVRFLVSERASYITGEKINVYGGGQAWR